MDDPHQSTDVYAVASTFRRRVRWQYILVLIAVILAGLSSRRFASYLPLLIRKRTGDALWACAVFLVLAILQSRRSTLTVTIAALLISYTIEFSQLYHRPWIDHIRSYTLGKLIFGTTFYWWDQVAYTVGILLLVPVDRWLMKRGAKNSVRFG